jgi:hypothetical protein
VGERIRDAKRRSVDPVYDRTVERLRRLPPNVFERLPGCDAQAVRLFYGLEGGRAHTLQEVASRTGRSMAWASIHIRKGVALLLS